MIYMVYSATADQIREMLEKCPNADAVYEMVGTHVSAIHVRRNSNEDDQEYTAYNRGDLCVELDGMLGDLIEQTMHRYMSKEEAKTERYSKIRDFADTIIRLDKVHRQ